MIRLGEKDAALDAKVLTAITGGVNTRPSQLVTVTGATHREVDRSLQRLRAARKIVFVSPVFGWKIK